MGTRFMHHTYLDDLRDLLARVRRRWRTARSSRAVARAAVAAVALLLVVLGTDRFLAPADLPMAVLAVGALMAALAFAGWTLWPLRRAPSDRQVARYIEERCPDLEDRLASATEVADSGRASAFRDLVLSDAAGKARGVDLDQVVARADVWAAIVRGLAATAALLLVLMVGVGPVGRIARTAWLYAFPYTATLSVEPGDARVVAGNPLRIRATLDGTVGAPTRTLPSVVLMAGEGVERTIEMRPAGDAYQLDLPSVDSSFSYRVRAATVTSDLFEVTALVTPRVEGIDVAYRYPAFTGLPPRVEPDGGDIYAPAGTEVTLTVRVDKPVREGALLLATGGRLELRPSGAHALAATLDVAVDDSYRVVVIDADGLTNPADIDYFIRTVFDRPPELAILRPGGDRDITPLEEVVIDARADDDYGLERFELVYSVIEREANAVDFHNGVRAPVIAGSHTIYAEELTVQPGDFISYYARARDTNTGPQAAETRSDIFFLQVRPFDQEFEEDQSQSLSAMDAGEVGNLAEVQKEIIVATWKLDRQRAAERLADDLTAVADAQAGLLVTARRVAERILVRGREITPETRGRRAVENEAMALAVEAMVAAAAELRAHDTDGAIPPEMEALKQLLKAQAEIRRNQVALQQGNQGAQNAVNRAQEDLSALFDQELRREQQTNYEDWSSAAEDETSEAESETLRRLRALAERQEALSADQQALAEGQDELEAQELARALERLTREQNELRQQMEELRQQLERMQRQGSYAAGGQSMTEVAEQMRQALRELRRRDPSEAARRGQEAAERLRDLERQMEGGSRAQRRQALGELQLEARQVAEAQRAVASETRQTEPGTQGRAARYRLAGQEDELADRVTSLEDRIETLLPQATGEELQTLNGARDDLRRGEVAPQMRELADRLRRTVQPPEEPQSETDGPERALEAIADADDELADVLERVAVRLQEASGVDATARRLSQQLQGAQDLRRRLELIEQQLERMAEAGGGPLPEAADLPGAQDQTLGGQVNKPGADQQPSPDGRPTPRQTENGTAGGGELAELQRALMRQLAESPELLEQLSRERPTLKQDLERWAQQWVSGPAPGTEAFKQDFSAWESLRDDVELALEAFEALRSRELTEKETDDRLNVGPNERMPEEYRRLVEEYYRSLATDPDRP